jgi:hypothetical protein
VTHRARRLGQSVRPRTDIHKSRYAQSVAAEVTRPPSPVKETVARSRERRQTTVLTCGFVKHYLCESFLMFPNLETLPPTEPRGSPRVANRDIPLSAPEAERSRDLPRGCQMTSRDPSQDASNRAGLPVRRALSCRYAVLVQHGSDGAVGVALSTEVVDALDDLGWQRRASA